MRWEHHSFFIPSDHCFRQCWCFVDFEVTLKFGRKRLLHFRGCIFLKATLCCVNTLSNWEMPSRIYSRTCYTFRYYLEELWLPLCELSTDPDGAFLLATRTASWERITDRNKSLKGSFFLLKYQDFNWKKRFLCFYFIILSL